VRDRAGTTGLPEGLKAGIESLARVSMDDVRVHANSARPSALRALAYTQGTDIYLAPGQEGNLAHEAWHVVQQKQGRVPPTLRAGGLSINTDRGLEDEADHRGAQAASVGPRGVPAAPARTTGSRTDVIQGVFTHPEYEGKDLESLLDDVGSFLGKSYSHLVRGFDRVRGSDKPSPLARWLEVNDVGEELSEILGMKDKPSKPASSKRTRSDTDDDVKPKKKKATKKKKEETESEEEKVTKKKPTKKKPTKKKTDETESEEEKKKEKKEPKLIDDFRVLRDDRDYEPVRKQPPVRTAPSEDPGRELYVKWALDKSEWSTSDDDETYVDEVKAKKKGAPEGPGHQALQDVFNLATFNIDHYPKGDVTERQTMDAKAMGNLTKVRKKKARMDEIAYYLTTDNPDVMAIQEINDYEGFARDFASAKFTTTITPEPGVIRAVEIDKLAPEGLPGTRLISSQYALIEQPKWSAGPWGEKNAIIVNKGTMDVSSTLWRSEKGREELKEIEASKPLSFGHAKSKKKKDHKPRDPVVTVLTYSPETPAERKVALINVHTAPSGNLKKQNKDIVAALDKVKNQMPDVDAAYAIGDFYMERSNSDLYQDLHERVGPLEEPEFATKKESAYTGVRTMFDTNIPSPHAPAYRLWDYKRDEGRKTFERRKRPASQPPYEPRETSKKGQKADDLVYRDDQWRPFNRLPNIYPPMFPPYPTEQGVFNAREARRAVEGGFLEEASPGRETYRSEFGEKFDLTQEHINTWGKPLADHALRPFSGELPSKGPQLQRRQSMRLGLKRREKARREAERRERKRQEKERRAEEERLEAERQARKERLQEKKRRKKEKEREKAKGRSTDDQKPTKRRRRSWSGSES
jgi:hypothetical protein